MSTIVEVASGEVGIAQVDVEDSMVVLSFSEELAEAVKVNGELRLDRSEAAFLAIALVEGSVEATNPFIATQSPGGSR